MKIISNYKDYYDAVQAYGVEQDIVYKRFQESVEISTNIGYGECSPLEEIYLNSKGLKNHYIKASDTTVGFCGKLYKGLIFREYKDKKLIQTEVFYQLEDVEKYLKKLQTQHRKISVIQSWYEPGLLDSLRYIDFQEFFEPNKSPKENTAIFQEIQAPIFVLENNIYHNSEDSKKIQVIKNPNLKDLGFYRVMESYLCFQEIGQFLGGVLVIKENIDSKLNDLDKVKQHGFDEKYGFRKRPKNQK